MLNQVFDEFNKRLGEFGKVYIAGGAVRDELMSRTPKDFDLFMLYGGNQAFQYMAKQIVSRIDDLEKIDSIVEWHNSEPFLAAQVRWQGVHVQIMARDLPSIDDLLDTFDWNVCLFGYDGNYHCKETVENIGTGKELKLNRITYPLSTLRRGFRFSERFLMKLRNEDIRGLCQQIIKPKEQ